MTLGGRLRRGCRASGRGPRIAAVQCAILAPFMQLGHASSASAPFVEVPPFLRFDTYRAGCFHRHGMAILGMIEVAALPACAGQQWRRVVWPVGVSTGAVLLRSCRSWAEWRPTPTSSCRRDASRPALHKWTRPAGTSLPEQACVLGHDDQTVANQSKQFVRIVGGWSKICRFR